VYRLHVVAAYDLPIADDAVDRRVYQGVALILQRKVEGGLCSGDGSLGLRDIGVERLPLRGRHQGFVATDCECGATVVGIGLRHDFRGVVLVDVATSECSARDEVVVTSAVRLGKRLLRHERADRALGCAHVRRPRW